MSAESAASWWRSDTGAGTVMTAGLVAVALLVALVGSTLAAVHLAGVRAQGAADSAALSAASLGAQSAPQGCQAAEQVLAAWHSVTLVSCTRHANTETWVVVRSPVVLPFLDDTVTVTRRARAGVPSAMG